MPTKKYFQPINISIQIGGYISTYEANEECPYPLSEDERQQIKTLWEFFTGACPFEILKQLSYRPLVEVTRRLNDGDAGKMHIQSIISDKFADAAFAAEFEKSVRDFLNKKLPDALDDAVNTALLGALHAASKEHGIRWGNAARLKKLLKGEGWPKPIMPEDTRDIVKELTPEMFAAPRTYIDKLIETHTGPAKGSASKRKGKKKAQGERKVKNEDRCQQLVEAGCTLYLRSGQKKKFPTYEEIGREIKKDKSTVSRWIEDADCWSLPKLKEEIKKRARSLQK